MPNPKHRHSHSRKNKRRAHDALTPVQLSTCPNCNAMKLPHRVCGSCGYYGRDRKVLEVQQ